MSKQWLQSQDLAVAKAKLLDAIYEKGTWTPDKTEPCERRYKDAMVWIWRGGHCCLNVAGSAETIKLTPEEYGRFTASLKDHLRAMEEGAADRQVRAYVEAAEKCCPPVDAPPTMETKPWWRFWR